MSHELVSQRRFNLLEEVLYPLQAFLEDDKIIEIMLNPDHKIWVDEAGVGMYNTGICMPPSKSEQLIRLVARHMNTEVSELKPSLQGKLPHWNFRVQASLPPIVDAPTFAFRKPSKFILTLADYVKNGVMTKEQATTLQQAVLARKNILVGGGAGSGKSTLANALLDVIPAGKERLYIVEDTRELQCSVENHLKVLVFPPVYTFRHAVMDALRYRPDRIILGEVRDGAALDLLKAWNTGHPGGIATLHADSTTSMLDRMAQLTEEVVPVAPYRLIAEAINMCVHIESDSTVKAGRKVTGIVEVKGFCQKAGWIFK